MASSYVKVSAIIIPTAAAFVLIGGGPLNAAVSLVQPPKTSLIQLRQTTSSVSDAFDPTYIKYKQSEESPFNLTKTNQELINLIDAIPGYASIGYLLRNLDISVDNLHSILSSNTNIGKSVIKDKNGNYLYYSKKRFGRFKDYWQAFQYISSIKF